MNWLLFENIKDNGFSLLLLLITSVLVYFFLLTEKSRLQRQYTAIHSFRIRLCALFHQDQSVFLNLIRPQGSSDEGFQILVCVWISCLFILGVTHLFEGSVENAMNIIALGLVNVAFLGCNFSKFSIQLLFRASSAHQLYSIWNFNYSQENLIRRACLMRSLGIIIFTESLEEGLLFMFLLSMFVDNWSRNFSMTTSPHLPLLPLGMYVGCIFPIRVLGIADWVHASMKGREFTVFSLQAKFFLRTMLYFSVLLPLCVIYSTYTNHVSENFYLILSVVQFLLGAMLMYPPCAQAVNQKLSPNFLLLEDIPVLSIPTKDSRTWNVFRWFQGVHGLGLVCCCALSKYLTVAFMMGLLSSALFFEQTQAFSEFQRNVSMFSAWFHLVWAEHSQVNAIVLFLSLLSSSSCILVLSSKAIPSDQIRRDRQADAFLSHAIKQKFAAVGATVEQVLMEHGEDVLLQKVLLECNVGHDRCHASTLYRRLEDGQDSRVGKRYASELLFQLQKTTLSSRMIPDMSRFSNNSELNQLCLILDWEIFQVLLTNWCLLGGVLEEIKVAKLNSPWVKISMILDRAPSNRNTATIIARLEKEIQGSFEGNVCTFQAQKMMLSSPEPYSSPHSSTSPSSFSRFLDGGDFHVLKPLIIALVDDNLLIRKNFERILIKRVGLSPLQVFSRGNTLEECRTFPQEISEKHVDIAIFDQNLDYGIEEEKGSHLALRAKQLGFKGCLILHSSNTAVLPVFDGVVEKSANAAKFLGSIVQIWQAFSSKQQEV